MGMNLEDENRCMEFFLAMLEHLGVEGGKLNVDYPSLDVCFPGQLFVACASWKDLAYIRERHLEKIIYFPFSFVFPFFF